MVPQVDPKQGDELTQLKQAIQYTQDQRENDATYEVAYSAALAPDDPPNWWKRLHGLQRLASAGG